MKKTMITKIMATIMTMCLLLACMPTTLAENATATEATVNYEAIIGSVRVQTLSGTLARVELEGPNGFENRKTYHIVGREWPGTPLVKVAGTTTTQLVTDNYTINVPNNAKSLEGITVNDANGREIWRYTSLPSAQIFLPDPGSTPKAWAIADNPRIVPAEWGYAPQPADNTQFTDLNGWDKTNDSPDMYIFMPKEDAKQLRKDFVALTGDSELTPIKSLGLMTSRYYPYKDTDIYANIDKYREEGFPLDYYVVDTNWRNSVGTSGTGYSVNTNYFPDISEFFRTLVEDKHVQTFFNDHPEPVNSQHALSKGDLEYRNTQLKGLFEKGLDAWWFDRNWQTTIISPFSGINKESFGMYLYQDITKQYYPNKRPFIMGNIDGIDNGVFARPANLASHRFSIQWTGDTWMDSNRSGMNYLKMDLEDTVRSGAVTSNPYISADLTGHNGNPSPHRYTRWSQFGALSPIMRYHCYTTCFREPWKYGKLAQDPIVDYVAMRYRLLPLFYALNHENYGTGIPLTKRLDFNYPWYAEAQDNTEYLLGDGILVAPFVDDIPGPTTVPATWLTSDDGTQGLSQKWWNVPTAKPWNVEAAMSGTPVLSRVVNQLNYTYSTSSSTTPGTGVTRTSHAGRFTGKVKPDQDCYLALNVDDGVRVYLNGELVVNRWNDISNPDDNGYYNFRENNRGPALIYSDNLLKAGTEYDIKIEYYSLSSGWGIQLQYVKPSDFVNTRSVFIPDGKWIDVWSGIEYEGPRTISVSHGIDTSPIFVRGGSIVPLAENVSYIGEKPWNKMSVDVYPSTQLKGTQTVFEDDGVSTDYKEGKVRKTELQTSYDKASGEVVVNVAAANGSFKGDDAFTSRTWNVRVHAPASWGALLTSKLDGNAVTAQKVNKDSSGAPFAFEGASPDSDVYIVTFTAPLSKASEIRVKFATPQNETLPTYSDKPVDYSVKDVLLGNTVDLTSAGADDWVHFGNVAPASATRKAGVTNRKIGDLTVNGTASLVTNGRTGFSWSDGNSPLTATDNKNRISVSNTDEGFEMDVKVGPQDKLITVYLGGDSSTGRFSVTDGTNRSAQVVNLSGASGSYSYKVKINANAKEETVLHLSYVKTGGTGTISFIGAAVSDVKQENLEVFRASSFETAPSSLNLTTGNFIDWVKVGVSSSVNLDRKKGVNFMSDPTFTGTMSRFTDYPTQMTWTADDSVGGTSGSNNREGRHIPNGSIGGYYTFSVPSTTQLRRLDMYFGAWNATISIDVTDEKGLKVDTYSVTGGGSSNTQKMSVYFRSEVDSVLNVKVTIVSGSGNGSLAGYTLSEATEPAILDITTPGLNQLLSGYGATIPVQVSTVNITNPSVNVKLVGSDGTVCGEAVTNASGFAAIKITNPLSSGYYRIEASTTIGDSTINKATENNIRVRADNDNPWESVWRVFTVNNNGLLTFQFNADISDSTNLGISIDGKPLAADAFKARLNNTITTNIPYDSIDDETTIDITNVRLPFFGRFGFKYSLVGLNPAPPAPKLVNFSTNADTPAAEGVGNLFDNNTGTKLYTGTMPIDIFMEYSTAVTIDTFRIGTAGDTANYSQRNPKTFTIAGSNDGTNWTTFYTMADANNIIPTTNQALVSVSLDNPVTYKHYRLQITARRSGNSGLQFSEFNLIGPFNRNSF